MSAQTAIEWTDATWNPVTGCTEVSPGCDHCYAKTFAERWRGTPGHYFENGFDVQLRPDKLPLPMTWRKPRKIFVNSMSDLFHDSVPDEFIARVFGVMSLARRHTFQVLTKRHGRMRALLNKDSFKLLVQATMYREKWSSPDDTVAPWFRWPLPNVWVGVSVENQQWADIRIPALLDTPAAVRWLSCEPLLGPVKLPFVTEVEGCTCAYGDPHYPHEPHCGYEPGPAWGKLHWVVAGGESGVGHRPLDLAWVRSLRDQCAYWNVPFLFKQVGGRTPKAGGRELDGRTWDQYPERAA